MGTDAVAVYTAERWDNSVVIWCFGRNGVFRFHGGFQIRGSGALSQGGSTRVRRRGGVNSSI